MANNRVQVKRTSTTGRTPNTTGSYATNSQYISAGELALNMTDGILYSSDGTNLITVGSNLATQRITSNITFDNNSQLRFRTVNTSAYAYFTQQNDDNFVFYTTNASYAPRAVFSIFANSSTSDLQFGQPVTFNGANVKFSTTTALSANGSLGSAGQVLTTNGSTVYWSSVSGSGSVNVAAAYTWTNLHTFQANVAFTGNGIGLTTNTAAIYLGGLADNNWKIGRNTGSTTKWRYTNNSIDVIVAASALEGYAIGLISGNSYFETGYLGTYIAANVTIGNSSSNSTINSTAFSGTASNATNLNSQPGSYYTNATNITTGTLPYAQIPANIVNTTGSFTLSGNTTLAGTNTVISSNVNITGTFINVASAFLVNSTGAYHTGTMNAASHTVGTSTIANSTGVYAGVVNATTISTGSVNVINASGLTTTANVSIGAAGDLIIAAGAGISANGGFGTSGQVLTSNASSIYWSTIAAGATLNANNTETGTFYFGMANTTSGTWSNAVVSTTKISFVPNTGALTVNGSISATTKSFLINHPTKSGMKLRYASLEGPENGVYVRGKINGYVIELPDYWTGLVDEDTITVQLTAIGEPQSLFVVEVSDNQVFINSNEGVPYCYYTVYGERKDVDKLIVEY